MEGWSVPCRRSSPPHAAGGSPRPLLSPFPIPEPPDFLSAPAGKVVTGRNRIRRLVGVLMVADMTAPPNARRLFPEVPALREVFSSPRYLIAYAISAPLVGVAYAILLPGLMLSSYQLSVLRFLTPTEAVFAGAMGILLPPVLLLNVYLWRHPECRRAGRSAAAGPLGALLVSVIPNASCCTPIIPLVLAVFVSGATLVSISASVQSFLGTYAAVLYTLSALALWGSMRVASRRVCIPGSAANDGGAPAPT